MSALGHKQIFAVHSAMSAKGQTRTPPLLEHLIGGHSHDQRYREAKRFGGLEVDEQLEFSRLLYRKIGRLVSLKNLTHIDSSQTICIGNADAVAQQASSRCKFSLLIDRRH